jgi:hypothetical protein
MHSRILALSILFAVCGCASESRKVVSDFALDSALPAAASALAQPSPTPRSMKHEAYWYFPNRWFDFFDTFRFGVDLGPGIGADVAFSHHLRAAGMYRNSVGLGFQTFRQSPTKNAFEKYHYFSCGPAVYAGGDGPGWYHHEWDGRIELHLLVIGAHVALNAAEIGDFFFGFALLDPMYDDR